MLLNNLSFLALLLLTTTSPAALAQTTPSEACRKCAADCDSQVELAKLYPGLFNVPRCWTECATTCFGAASASNLIAAGAATVVSYTSTSPLAAAAAAVATSSASPEQNLAGAESSSLITQELLHSEQPAKSKPTPIAALVLGVLAGAAMVTTLIGYFTVRARRRRANKAGVLADTYTNRSSPMTQYGEGPGFKSIDLKRESMTYSTRSGDVGVTTLAYDWDARTPSPRSRAGSFSNYSMRPSRELHRTRSTVGRSLRATLTQSIHAGRTSGEAAVVGPHQMPITSSDVPQYDDQPYEFYDADSASNFVNWIDGNDYYDEPTVVSADAPAPLIPTTPPPPMVEVNLSRSSSSAGSSPVQRQRSLSVSRRPVPRYVPDDVEVDAYSTLGHGASTQDFQTALGHAVAGNEER